MHKPTVISVEALPTPVFTDQVPAGDEAAASDAAVLEDDRAAAHGAPLRAGTAG